MKHPVGIQTGFWGLWICTEYTFLTVPKPVQISLILVQIYFGSIDGQCIGMFLQKWFCLLYTCSLYATIFHPSFETNFSKSFFATYEKFAIVSIDHNDFMAIIFEYLRVFKDFQQIYDFLLRKRKFLYTDKILLPFEMVCNCQRTRKVSSNM